MVIDTKKCIGCFACAVACKSHNNLPNNVWWNRIECVGGDFYDTPSGTYEEGNLAMHYTPITCQHCEKPLCVSVCPTGASYKDPDTGIVGIDYDTCIGCGTCLTGCPYGVRTLYEEALEYYVDFPVGDWDAPEHKPNTVGKCTYCANRIGRDEVPMCMDICPARARYWGDWDDPESAVNKYVAGKEYTLLLEDEGTEPNTRYI
jgi:molybdopterin-containing oxidoreductase family iron-sulfur binding subunit